MKHDVPPKQNSRAWRALLVSLLLCCPAYTDAAPARAIPPTARQEMLERVTAAIENTTGLTEQELDTLCRHYGLTYSGGMCKSAAGSVPADKLAEVAALHYPELGDALAKRRDAVAKLEKMCGKKGHKLKNRLEAYSTSEQKLQELDEAPESRRKRYSTALDKAAADLTAVQRHLRKLGELEGSILQNVSRIQGLQTRTDVSIVKGKGGFRLAANVAKNFSPDQIIREQQYVWGKEEEDDEGIDL